MLKAFLAAALIFSSWLMTAVVALHQWRESHHVEHSCPEQRWP